MSGGDRWAHTTTTLLFVLVLAWLGGEGETTAVLALGFILIAHELLGLRRVLEVLREPHNRHESAEPAPGGVGGRSGGREGL